MQGTFRDSAERNAFRRTSANVHVPAIQRHEISPIRELLSVKEDLIVMDIGAHKGVWTAALLRLLPGQVRHVYMIDASPENYRELTRLDDHLALTPDEMKLVSAYHYAMSDTPGIITLYTNDDGSPLASVYKDALRGWGAGGPQVSQSFSVPADTVDDFVERESLERIHVLKVDTEGHELSVFKGASKTLTAGKVDVLLFEFGTHQIQARNYFADFFDFFSEHGYKMYNAEQGVLSPIDEYTWKWEDLSRLHQMLAVKDPPPLSGLRKRPDGARLSSASVLAGANRRLRFLARQLISWSRKIPAGDRMRKSLFEETIEADGREISGSDLLWLYKQSLIVILDYSVSTTLDVGIERSEEILSKLLSKGDQEYEEFLRYSANFVEVFGKVEHTANPDGTTPYWDNGWLPTLDAISLMTILSTNPNRYIEVGSGNSTKFARHVISELGLRTKIISIDPRPRAGIDSLCDEVVRTKLEYCDRSMFNCLGDGDVFFLDGSHRAFQNSDVAQFFVDVLPRMQPSCIYGLHDIFTPKDYAENFRNRYYNEQYLLEAYLLGGAAGDSVLLPCAYVAYNSGRFHDALDKVWNVGSLKSLTPWGSAIWMRRGPRAQAGERAAEADGGAV